MRWPPQLPQTPRFVLAGAAVPACLLDDPAAATSAERDGLVRADIVIHNGCIDRIDRSGAPTAHDAATACIELDGGQVWPCFVDMHTHLDKGHIWPRAENPDGTFAGA